MGIRVFASFAVPCLLTVGCSRTPQPAPVAEPTSLPLAGVRPHRGHQAGSQAETGTSASPRLEAIRPHLKAGTRYAKLVAKIGTEDINLGDEVLRPVYLLDGKHKELWLLLEFDGDRLRSARVCDPEQEWKVIEVVLDGPDKHESPQSIPK